MRKRWGKPLRTTYWVRTLMGEHGKDSRNALTEAGAHQSTSRNRTSDTRQMGPASRRSNGAQDLGTGVNARIRAGHSSGGGVVGRRRRRGLGNLSVCLLLFSSFAVRPATTQVAKADIPASCEFHPAGDHAVGSCGPLFDQNRVITLRRAPSITTGAWRSDMKPISVWSGDMTDQGYPNAPVELEIYAGNWGVLRTEYGWFPVSDFVARTDLSFRLDSRHEVEPSALDLSILEKAAEILSTGASWNRADNRECSAKATTWSIYCSLEKAEIEVAGGFHHRRPAAELVRKIVDERTRSRRYHHRLMEYNNDPTTHLQDVQSLFKEAESQINTASK